MRTKLKMGFKSIFKLSGCNGCCKNKSGYSVVESTVSEYVQKSTIHGVAYIGDDERNKFERIWWFIILICSVLGACYLIYQAYRTMKENPIIESPSLSRTPMWEVPFPAVTFCPVGRDDATSLAVDINNWPNFTHSLLPDNLTDVIDYVYLPKFLSNLLLQRSYQNNYDLLSQFMPEIEIAIAGFGSMRALHLVAVSFQTTITSHGACVTFNMFQEKDILRDGVVQSSLDDATNKTEQQWSRDSGFYNNLPLSSYINPLRLFCPTDDSFFTIFNVNDSQRFIPFGDEIVAAFHAPDELPLFDRHSEFVSIVPGKDNRITIAPRLVISEGIQHYDPIVRQCYYSDERYLKFYKTYTQQNCEMECLANYTLAECECVHHCYPHFNNTKLCTTVSGCVSYTSSVFYRPNFTDNVVHAPIDDCNCLPSCTHLSFKPVVEKTLDVESGTRVKIYTKNLYIDKHVRTELHSISEFFSNCGGSLGLLLGVSIFSIVELFYFCTVRLYLHSKRRRVDRNE